VLSSAVVVAGDPLAGRRGLPAQLVEIERSIRSPFTTPVDLARLGRRQDSLYRLLAGNPEWAERVMASIPADLQPAVSANLKASRELRAMADGSFGPLPHWQIIAPPEPEQLIADYREAEARFHVAWSYLAAINLVETRMGRIRGLSPAGARGPMQFMPQTWTRYGKGNIDDPRDAILAAARYLKATGAPRNMNAALFSYNNSWNYVRAIKAYASVMALDPRAYYGYYYWQVVVPTPAGDLWLPEGSST
jgi:soluble lytic murein transglycosylase-like protein